MNQIFCGYYDEEMEQDVPLEPTLDEAVSFFENFIWENKNSASALKIIFFQTSKADDAALQISYLAKNAWSISASASKRRRFLGPFFKRNIFKIFLDKNKLETKNIIRALYQNTSNDFVQYLECSEE